MNNTTIQIQVFFVVGDYLVEAGQCIVLLDCFTFNALKSQRHKFKCVNHGKLRDTSLELVF